VAYPDVEIEVLVRYGFDVEAYCWYCCDYFSYLHAWLVILLLLFVFGFFFPDCWFVGVWVVYL